MRIAFISYEFPPDSSSGGIATYLAQAAGIQARRGHEVEVFAASPSRDETVVQEGIVVHWIREVERVDFGLVAGHRFAARHAEKPFDVLEGPEYNADARKALALVPEVPLVVKLHTPSRLIASISASGGLALKARFLGGNLKLQLAAWQRGEPPPPFYFSSRQTVQQLDALERAHARRAAIVAPPCHDLCRFAEEAWQIDRDRIRYSPHPYVPPPALLRLEPRDDGQTVGFVGRLERRKGIETLAAAIPLVLRAVPQARFRLIGAAGTHPDSGRRYDEWLREQTRPFADRIDIPGKVDLARMSEAYASLDICAFPSVWENFPNVCLEAMAAARAVVGSSAGGMAEMLDGGQAGRLVPPGDPKALAAAIIALLRAPDERRRLGEAARRRVLECYSEATIGAMMENIYREAIALKNR